MSDRRLLLSLVLVACAGCASGGAAHVPRVNDAEHLRATLAAGEAPKLAPQAFAVADQELKLAKAAQASGDATGADLHAERALAAYNEAVALGRLARATEAEAKAREALSRASEQAQRYSAQRKAIEREADDLEKRLRIAREARLPPPSGKADPAREKARLVAARALATEARLLCSAARLVSPKAPGLAKADEAVAAVDEDLEGRGAKKSVPIDAAARARAGCLASLTKARRTKGPASGEADALLADLSRSGAAVSPGDQGKGSPATHHETRRDERGVVVTLRGVFEQGGLTKAGRARIKELGQVSAAHPSFAIQVVVHDDEEPSRAESTTDAARGEAVKAALVEGGAPAAKIKVEQAGARAPVVDPADPKRRGRNARLEIVFVAPGT